MSMTTTHEMLKRAMDNGYAVGAFNVENMEMVFAVIRAAEAMRAPVILQTTPSTVRYGGLPMYAAMVRVAAEKATVPVAVHLDHGDSPELVQQAVAAGYTSVMIDGSRLPFEENIAVTQKAVSLAGELPVEAELGKVGGKEDDVESDGNAYTDPAEAKEFVRRTGISSLAVGIGTAHGFYTGIPCLNKTRLKEIRQIVDIPLVLHGASGVPDEDVRDCIALGISKVNFATELRVAYTKGVREYLSADAKAFDPKKYGTAGMHEVEELVKRKIQVCGCENRY